MSSQSPSSLALAAQDFRESVKAVHIWAMLGWQDIKQRYRRSVIGPFWLTISYGAMIAGMGPLYGRLLQQDISAYIPYLAVSFVAWILLSNLINEGCSAFISAEGFIKQIKLPLTIHVLRVVWRNLLIFAHNFVIVLLVMFFFPPQNITWALLTVPLGALAIAVNGVWIGTLFGLLCARYRDIPQVVSSFVQIAFFLTPVMWRPEMLGANKWAADWNPMHHLLQVVRAPLLTGGVPVMSWAVVLGVTALGSALAFWLFKRYRSRVAYWV